MIYKKYIFYLHPCFWHKASKTQGISKVRSERCLVLLMRGVAARRTNHVIKGLKLPSPSFLLISGWRLNLSPTANGVIYHVNVWRNLHRYPKDWVWRASRSVSRWCPVGPYGVPAHESLSVYPIPWLQEIGFTQPSWSSLSFKGQVQIFAN